MSHNFSFGANDDSVDVSWANPCPSRAERIRRAAHVTFRATVDGLDRRRYFVGGGEVTRSEFARQHELLRGTRPTLDPLDDPRKRGR